MASLDETMGPTFSSTTAPSPQTATKVCRKATRLSSKSCKARKDRKPPTSSSLSEQSLRDLRLKGTPGWKTTPQTPAAADRTLQFPPSGHSKAHLQSGPPLDLICLRGQ